MHAAVSKGAAIRGLGLALLLAILSLAAALASGSEWVPWRRLIAVLTGAESNLHADIVLGLRLPRALAAFAVGGLLALAGALMQVLLRNPLADPYVLGLAGGAAVGALGTTIAGVAGLAGPAAFAGALLSTLIVFSLARADAERF